MVHNGNDEYRKRVFEYSSLPIVIMDADSYRFIDCNSAAVKIYGLPSRNAVIGKTPADVSAPTQYDGSPSKEKSHFYIEKAKREGSTIFNWRHQRPDATVWDAEVHLLKFDMEEQPLLQFTLIDITERLTVDRIQTILRDLMFDLNACDDFQLGLEKVLTAVLQLDYVDSGGIYLVDQSTGVLTIAVHRGLSEEYITHCAYFPREHPNTHLAFAGEAIYGKYSKIIKDNDLVYGEEMLHTAAIIPIMVEGTLIGCMNLFSHMDDSLSIAIRNALEMIVFQVGGSLRRLRAEGELKESNDLLSRFINQSPIYTYIKSVTSSESRVLYASDNFRDMIGVCGSEMIGKSMIELFPPEFAVKITEDDMMVVSKDTTIQIEEVLNGRTYITIKSPIRQEKRCLLAGYTIDITERKMTENALQRSELQFKTLFMSVSEGIYISEPVYDDTGKPCDYRYLEVNPKFEQILGLKRQDIVGKRYREIVPVDTTRWLDNYLKVVTTGEPSTYYFYSKEYDSHFETYAYPTALGQVVVFVRDISERKRTEAALQKIQKLESLGLLAGGIAHDFNNLLGGIYGYIDLAIQTISGSADTMFLEKALQTIDHARGLTKQLLTFAKGGEPIKRVDYLSPFLQETADFALSGSNCTCTFSIPKDLWLGEFDRNQIGQVIGNIVINAQQAMPHGGVIEIAAENKYISEKEHMSLIPGRYIKLSITDQGSGIPPDILSRIFDPFFTTKVKGHGLGLATCYSIVNRHCGAIDVTSELGKGTTFHIYIPAAVISDVPDDTISAPPHQGHGTILIMDDDDTLRIILREVLTVFGYSVIGTSDGKEALTAFLNDRTDKQVIVAMIFDLTVPGGWGGNDIIDEIRAIDTNIPVFVASGYADDPILADPQRYGFTGSIGKPFLRNELAELLNRYCT